MKAINRDLLRFKDIVQSISIIQGYTGDIDEEQFVKSEMMQSACIRHFEIIGEASKSITSELKSGYPNIPWKQIIGLRNIVTHEYFRVDVYEIWMTIQTDLPTLEDGK